MDLTAKEKATVLAVFDDVLRMPYSEINKFIGSETIKDMSKLYQELRYEWYCDKYNIRYDDMTEDDFIRAYEEKEVC